MEQLAAEQPVGTEHNSAAIDMIEARLMKMGCSIESLPFGCNVWRWGPSTIQMGDDIFDDELESLLRAVRSVCACVSLKG